MNQEKFKMLQIVRQSYYYNVSEVVNHKTGKGFAIMRKSEGGYVVERVYKTKQAAEKTCEKMNGKCLKTIKRVSAICNYDINDPIEWHVIDFAIDDILNLYYK